MASSDNHSDPTEPQDHTEHEVDADDIEDIDEGTIVVSRERVDDVSVSDDADEDDADDIDDGTVVVSRESDEEHDHTIAVDRGLSVDETFVVPRPSAGAGKKAGSKRRSGLAAPPTPIDFSPPAVVEVEPGAQDTYSPRPIPEQPTDAPVLEEGPAATRAHAPSMPSVRRQGRFIGRTALIALPVSVVLAVGGVVLLITAVW